MARYSTVAICLHWLIALGIFVQIALGLFMTGGGLAMMEKFRLYQLHKSIGITVLLLVVARLLWRLAHRPPALPAGMKNWERGAAGGMHWLLYGMMFALPLTGWALVSASPLHLPTVLFGIVPWPHLPPFNSLADKAGAEAVLKMLHHRAAWLLIVLLLVHAGAALRHHFILHDGILHRMLPFGRRSGFKG